MLVHRQRGRDAAPARPLHRLRAARTQFGRAIGSFQAVAHQIVDMKIRLETARKWLYDTAQRLPGRRERHDRRGHQQAPDQRELRGVEPGGGAGLRGNGYMAEYGVEKDLRDAVAGTIYSGTTEIQYNRIASLLGL